MLGLLALFGDTVFFLILASFGTEHVVWLVALFYLYILSEALVFFSSVEVVVITVSCAASACCCPRAHAAASAYGLGGRFSELRLRASRQRQTVQSMLSTTS